MTVMTSAQREPVSFRGFGDLPIAADRSGQPDGSTALLLHGGGQTRHSWHRTARALQQRTAVVATDTRGHGESGWSPDGDYQLTTLCADVLCVLDQLATPTVIVGASLGGLTGLLAADRAGPARVTGLVLVDAVPRYEAAGSKRIRDFMRHNPEGFATAEEAAALVQRFNTHSGSPDVDSVRRHLRRGENNRWYWHWDPAFMFLPSNDPIRWVDELERAAAALTIPLLLVRGARSDVVSETGVQNLLRVAPHTRVVELPGVAHAGAGERNDAFTVAVAEFVWHHARPSASEYPVRPAAG